MRRYDFENQEWYDCGSIPYRDQRKKSYDWLWGERFGAIFVEADGAIVLPHQCDEWVIGTFEDAEQMLKDLRSAIEFAQTIRAPE